MRADSQPFKYVRERDIDLLLLEELSVTREFRHWFLQKLGVDPAKESEFVGAWHSVSDSALGESDLEFGIRTRDESQLLILLENKIDAPYQQDQLQRYRERGVKAISEEWDEFFTALVAPDGYLGTKIEEDTVDAIVKYEELQDWFDQRDSQRASFKATMLEDAILQERRGRTSEPDEAVTDLHRRYWNIARREFPHLKMDEPTGVPKNNMWIRFKIPSLPKHVKLRHKMGKGNVDLEFRGQSSNEEKLIEQYQRNLERGMEIVASGSSMFIRGNVPPITVDDDAVEREDRIRTGLETANDLLEWYQDKKEDSSL